MIKGWKVTAIDIDEQNLRETKQYAFEIHFGDALSILSALLKNHYDGVLALEIIEHMPKPQGMELLGNIQNILKPKGTLLLSTPNRFSLEYAAGYWWGEKFRRRGKYMAWDKTHVYIYSSWEIVRNLKKFGFSVDRIIGYWYGAQLPLSCNWKFFFKFKAYPFNMLGFNIILECQKQ